MPIFKSFWNDLRNYLQSPPQTASGPAFENGEPKEETIVDLIKSLEVDLPPEKEIGFDLASLIEFQDAPPIRKLVNMVFLLAIKDRASDIHFETFEDAYKIRYRCDGVLYELVPPPRHLATAIADRVKVMANLDTAERRLPQQGRIDLNVGGNPIGMRVSVLPTIFGEHIAIRLSDQTDMPLDLNRIGMEPELLSRFRDLIHKPHGVILVTGPTGSGKTTTLYAALNELNDTRDKIITAEDPVESDIDGIVQCGIPQGLTFADTWRSILAQNPDVIAVGEIRDPEAAQLAVQAALTGRLVLSTLAAHAAASSITRLRGVGLEPSLIAATVKGILAQRLVRKICEDCRTQFEPSPEMLMDLNITPAAAKGRNFYYGQGCHRCNNFGYRGRMGLFELLVVNDSIRDMVSGGASSDQLRQACRQLGMTTLRESGLRALFEGKTTIEEVVRETVLEDEG